MAYEIFYKPIMITAGSISRLEVSLIYPFLASKYRSRVATLGDRQLIVV